MGGRGVKVAVAVGVIATLLVFGRWITAIPGGLVAVVGAIAISWGFDLESHGVAVLGPVPSGLPAIGLPSGVGWSDVVPLLAFREGKRGKYPVDAKLMLRPAADDGSGFLGIQVQVALRHGKSLQVITCNEDPHLSQPGVKAFQPIGTYDLPEYPEQKIFYPPLLEMLDYCYREGFTHIHTSTPGPIGLAALVIARILKIPITGTYHTAIPQYAQILTGDAVMESLTWKYTLWYYDQLDVMDTYQQVQLIIESLPEQQRSIIHLRDIDGLEFKEISEILNMDLNLIRVNLSRARKKVREEYEKINLYGREKNTKTTD